MQIATNPSTDRPPSIGRKAGTVLRHALFASLLAVAAGGAAHAQDPGPWLANQGGSLEVVSGTSLRQPVGGGAVGLSGGGENEVITYGATADTHAQRGLVAEMLGGGNDAVVVYRQPVRPAIAELARADGGFRS
ncbi:hypothetical protein [Siccirubricoccus sp. G192]|uniref:hypothetical protein n=1 Tax=Siccirubricoccus sp. G192 TaxID=2849651 RepID=UPI001C2B9AA0|nr:hypothetical protein [Siccirubricoccus sp. G192]MBV1796383.1 hypothetical protein [Siccirubricoccus sp. G192]